MHNRIIVLIIGCTLLSCRSDSCGLFYNQELNQALELFISEHSYDTEEVFFHIYLGNNCNGTKVDFVALDHPLNYPVHFFEPVELVYLGNADSMRNMSVFGCKGDDYKNVLRANALHSKKSAIISSMDNVRPIICSYQLRKDDTLCKIDEQIDCSYDYFMLMLNKHECNGAFLVLNKTTKGYIMLLPDSQVIGTWNEFGAHMDSVSFTPQVLSLYSTVKNEMIPAPLSSIDEIMNLTSREIITAKIAKNNIDSLIFKSGSGDCIKWVKSN